MIRRALLAALLFAAPAAAQDTPPGIVAEGIPGVPLFESPAAALDGARAGALARRGRLYESEAAFSKLVARFPAAPGFLAARAEVAAAQNRFAVAAEDLGRAVDLGFGDAKRLLAGPPLNRYAGEARMKAVAARPAPPPAPPRTIAPALVKDGVAPVSADNSAWDPRTARIRPAFVFPPRIKRLSVYPSWRPEPVWDRLQTLVSRGYAAGNTGDLYDNRDDGHSPLRRSAPTQLSHVTYDAAARAAGVHYGLPTQFLFDAPTFGNSSTAWSGPRWGSLPRVAMTTPGGATTLALHYANNHIYIFPEHRDHDPVAAGGKGDVLPANTPYVLISQGSSGSDQPLMRAVQMLLAAMPVKVKAMVRAQDLIAPTVQQMFRRAMLPPDAPAGAYLTGAAHPAVFDGAKVDLGRMLDIAQALTPETLPPLARIRVEAEPAPADPEAATLGERLFTTPHAVARLWRGRDGMRRYVLGAEGSEDPNGKALTFHWRVLLGDPARIAIRPLDPAGRRVEVTLPWFDALREDGPGGLAARRVDIGLFADNGAALSAPAFFSVAYPTHQRRVYAPGPDGPLLQELSDLAPGWKVYADPAMWPRRRWTDRFEYDDAGALTGWTRTPLSGPAERFTAQGLRVARSDAQGRPTLVEAVAYRIGGSAGDPVLEEAPSGRRFAIDYTTRDDRTGRPRPAAEGQ